MWNPRGGTWSAPVMKTRRSSKEKSPWPSDKDKFYPNFPINTHASSETSLQTQESSYRHPSIPTCELGEDAFPVPSSRLLRCPQRAVWLAVADGEKLFELFQGQRLLPCDRHHRHKRLPVGLHRIPQATTAVQALLELEDHTGHPEGQKRRYIFR